MVLNFKRKSDNLPKYRFKKGKSQKIAKQKKKVLTVGIFKIPTANASFRKKSLELEVKVSGI